MELAMCRLIGPPHARYRPVLAQLLTLLHALLSGAAHPQVFHSVSLPFQNIRFSWKPYIETRFN